MLAWLLLGTADATPPPEPPGEVCLVRTYHFVDSANRWLVLLDGVPRLLLRNRSHHCFVLPAGPVNVELENPELSGYTKVSASTGSVSQVATGRYSAHDRLEVAVEPGARTVLRVQRVWSASRWRFELAREDAAWLDGRRLRPVKPKDLEITPEVLRNQLGAERAAELLPGG